MTSVGGNQTGISDEREILEFRNLLSEVEAAFYQMTPETRTEALKCWEVLDATLHNVNTATATGQTGTCTAWEKQVPDSAVITEPSRSNRHELPTTKPSEDSTTKTTTVFVEEQTSLKSPVHAVTYAELTRLKTPSECEPSGFDNLPDSVIEAVEQMSKSQFYDRLESQTVEIRGFGEIPSEIPKTGTYVRMLEHKSAETPSQKDCEIPKQLSEIKNNTPFPTLESAATPSQNKVLCSKEGLKLESERQHSTLCPFKPNKTGEKRRKNDRDKFRCEKCDKTLSNEIMMEKHRQAHDRNDCKTCGARFTKREASCKHAKTAHLIQLQEKSYDCEVCRKAFSKRTDLYEHLQIHVKGEEIVCNRCGTLSRDVASHEKHAATHKFRARGHDKYGCGDCDRKFGNKKRLFRHRKEAHGAPSNEKNSKCDSCDKAFYRPSQLRTHKMEEHSTEPVSFDCKNCSLQFSEKSDFKNHPCLKKEKPGSKKKPFLCSECGAQFLRRQGLQRHVAQRHSEERPFSCPHCDFATKNKTNLKRHVDLHSSERTFVCEKCGKSFRALGNLKEHDAYVHSNNRNHVCGSCGKSFKSQSALKRHDRVHSVNRPYRCHCGQSYKRMSHLKRHMLSSHNMAFKSTKILPVNEDGGAQENASSLNEEETTEACEETLLIIDSEMENQQLISVAFNKSDVAFAKSNGLTLLTADMEFITTSDFFAVQDATNLETGEASAVLVIEGSPSEICDILSVSKSDTTVGS